MIKTSLDWQQQREELRARLYKLVHSEPIYKRSISERQHLLDIQRDMQLMLATIDSEVTELSKQEVKARQLKNSKITENQLLKVNDLISNWERWFVMAVMTI